MCRWVSGMQEKQTMFRDCFRLLLELIIEIGIAGQWNRQVAYGMEVVRCGSRCHDVIDPKTIRKLGEFHSKLISFFLRNRIVVLSAL